MTKDAPTFSSSEKKAADIGTLTQYQNAYIIKTTID